MLKIIRFPNIEPYHIHILEEKLEELTLVLKIVKIQTQN